MGAKLGPEISFFHFFFFHVRTFITVVLSGLGQYLHFPFNLETDPVQDLDRTEEEWITSEHRTQGWANDFAVVVKASRHSNWLWWSPSRWRDGVHLWMYVWLLGYVRKEAQMKLQESKGECVHVTATVFSIPQPLLHRWPQPHRLAEGGQNLES